MQSKSILYSSTELERKGFLKRSGGKKIPQKVSFLAVENGDYF
jgi:hypothetical protein